MKALFKGMMVCAAMLLAVTSASAAQENENISFDYQNNTFNITESTTVPESELTVMLIKGDRRSDDLSAVAASDFYYVGQKTGTKYDAFGVLGIKFDDNSEVEPGVYTLVTGGDEVDVTKTKVVIGNVMSGSGELSSNVHSGLKEKKIEFGKVDATFRVYGEDDYAYVCVGTFNYSQASEMGFIFQRKVGDGKVEKAYKELTDMNNSLAGIASISENAEVQIAIQMNNIPENTEFVAIPYVSAQ